MDEEQVALFEGDGLLVATQVLIITPTKIFTNMIVAKNECQQRIYNLSYTV